MSEYWVSNKKYFCKYCNIYIADDKPSRTQHEGGLRHKGNVERFVRGLYKTGAQKKQDLEEEKREMARVEKAAQAAFAQDIGAGLVKPGSSSTAVSTSSAAGPSKPVARSSDKWADYSTAESLGYTDPDAERRKMEEECRMKEGLVGAWEIVEVLDTEEGEGTAGQDGVDGAQRGGQVELERKRQAEAEAQQDDDDLRPWKLRKKTVGVGLGEIYDPGIVPIKLKAKKEEIAAEPESQPTATASNSKASEQTATALPRWSAKGWNRPSSTQDSEKEKAQPGSQLHIENGPRRTTEYDAGSSQAPDPSPPKVVLLDVKPTPSGLKVEETSSSIKAEEVEASPTPTATGGLFRKRKAPVGGGSRGRR